MRKFSLFVGFGILLSVSCKNQDGQQTSETSATQNKYWYGAEMRTKKTYGELDKPLKVTWRVKPATGNCAVTLLSLYNGDRIFSTNHGHWSEMTFEIFGGAIANPPDFQTQYITRNTPSESATARGKGHVVLHAKSPTVPNIFDGKFHDFQMEWKPSNSAAASLTYRVDGKQLRKDSGGDLQFLEAGLDIYTAAWMGKLPGEASAWGCTSAKARPDATAVILDSFVVEQFANGKWGTLENRQFAKLDDLTSAFDLSDWTFESFAGKYCPANAVWQNNSEIRLELDHHCGPN